MQREDSGNYIKCDACGRDAICNAWGTELCRDCKEDWWRDVVLVIHREVDDARTKLLAERTPKWAAAKRKAVVTPMSPTSGKVAGGVA